jgi:hypothetical protein
MAYEAPCAYILHIQIQLVRYKHIYIIQFVMWHTIPT